MLNYKLVLISLFLFLFSACSGTYTLNDPLEVSINTSGENSVNTNIKDYIGNQAKISIFSDLLVGERISHVTVQFQYNIAPHDVIVTSVNGGNVTQSNSEAVLQSGSNLNGEVHIESVESIKYNPGHEGYGLYTVVWENGAVDGVTQYSGIYADEEDGYFIGYNSTRFGVGLFKGGIEDFVNESDFNGDYMERGCILNQTNLGIYRISFGWLGIAPITYEHYCGSSIGWVNLHIMDKSHSQITPTIYNPVLPIMFHIKKDNVAENVIMRTASWNGGIINGGAGRISERPFSHIVFNSIPANTLTNLVTIKSNQTYFGKTNRVDTLLQFISISTDGNKNVEIQIQKNCDLTGESFSEVNVNNSIMYYDISATVSNCESLMGFQLGKVDNLQQELKSMDIHLHRNETITITAKSTAINDVNLALRWEELF